MPLYDITIPRISESWIKGFFAGTRKLLNQHKVSIIGGDTTKGPMSISITLIGVQKTKILTRSGAKTGQRYICDWKYWKRQSCFDIR